MFSYINMISISYVLYTYFMLNIHSRIQAQGLVIQGGGVQGVLTSPLLKFTRGRLKV
jgi:hypothetical protein